MYDLSIHENIPLGPLTTLKVGGPASRFVEAQTEKDVADAIALAEAIDVPVFILGGGSNVVISDNGFAGLVLKIAIKGVDFAAANDSIVSVTAGAGVVWDDFVDECVGRRLAGVECLSGIPGLVGGTPIQNVGAYGQDVSESIRSVRCFDRRSREFIELSNEDCEFAYRKSRFNSRDVGRFVVVGVRYELSENGEPKIAYRELADVFKGRRPNLTNVRDAVLDIRRKKSMVIDPDDVNSQSAGSFFKNPVVTDAAFENLKSQFPVLPRFPADAGMAKIPAAWLIENAGFSKGTRRGNAGISQNHSLALVNFGDAKAQEIRALQDEIQRAVREKFNLELVPEPVFVGF